ncbi:MAG: sulfotransferase [Cyclobacteriaceae bacterium]|nr:sulfotransferase [Cyclobacteriaceae bacterium]
MRSIQFIGTQRSGSNLLRVMLNQLPEIYAPHPPHILKTFFPLLHLYGNLHDQENFTQLVSDVCDWVNNNPVTWEGAQLNWMDIQRLCKKNDLISIFHAIYELKAKEFHAEFWCCKSMESVYYVDELEKSVNRPFYIYLYRDGRDVALSFKKAIVGPKHMYMLATKWRAEQELSLNFIKTIPESRYISICYEDFIHEPDKVIHKLCSKLGIPFSDIVFDFFNSKESRKTANSGLMWKNVSNPIIQNNFNKFVKELTVDEIILFEYLAGDMLQGLGYQPEFWPEIEDLNIGEDKIIKFKMLDAELMEDALLRAAPFEIAKRKPQEEIYRKIISRHGSSV